MSLSSTDLSTALTASDIAAPDTALPIAMTTTLPPPPLHVGLETETIVIFGVLALFALFVDIWAHRQDKPIALGTAVAWTLFWIAVSMCFALFLYYHFDGRVASLFLAGYLFEQALSVDNLFVMMAIFAWFKIPEQYCHRVLYWGVLGAIVFRLIFVLIGSTLFALGPIVEMIFALLVAFSGFMMLKKSDAEEDTHVDYSHHFAFRAVRVFFPVFPRLVGHSFFVSKEHVAAELNKPENANLSLKRKGAIYATPLFLCLAVIETTDVMFAFDSVPAVIAVSREPLIVYSAMIFAVMGLRSMYFVLDAMRQYLVHLEKAVIVLLFFIAFKLAASATLHLFGFGIDISVYTSLLVIAIILGLGIIASLIFPQKKEDKKAAQPDSKSDIKTDTQSDANSDTKPEAQPVAQVPQEVQAEATAATQADAITAAQTETSSVAQAEASSLAHADTTSITTSKDLAKTQAEAQAATQSASESTSATTSDSGADSTQATSKL